MSAAANAVLATLGNGLERSADSSQSARHVTPCEQAASSLDAALLFWIEHHAVRIRFKTSSRAEKAPAEAQSAQLRRIPLLDSAALSSPRAVRVRFDTGLRLFLPMLP